MRGCIASLIALSACLLTGLWVAMSANSYHPVAPEVRPAVWPTYAALQARQSSFIVAAPASLKDFPWYAVVIVECGDRVGTAFHIGGGRYITAAHVVVDGRCKIAAQPAMIVQQDGRLDIAEVQGPPERPKLDIDCSGFKVDHHYLSIGYPYGQVRMIFPLIYSAFGRDPDNGTGMFIGADVIPGMSGGPLINENYRVAGIVNQRWPSRSRPLADTYLCPGAHA